MLGRSIIAALILAFALCGAASGQDGRFRWRPLTVEDFRAPAPATRPGLERAEVRLVIEKRINLRRERDGRILVRNVEFAAFFDPNQAWFDRAGLPPASEAALLRHEQGHFDLTELTARALSANAARIATEMEEAVNTDPAKRQRMAELIEARSAEASRQRMALLEASSPTLQRLLAEEEATQDLYETETGHGINAARQAEWEADIRRRLEKSAPALSR